MKNYYLFNTRVAHTHMSLLYPVLYNSSFENGTDGTATMYVQGKRLWIDEEEATIEKKICFFT